jgi:endonuclease/exonuclease/phosphatase family metal-dependent hydrolase
MDFMCELRLSSLYTFSIWGRAAMTLKIASYNLENLFTRPAAMNASSDDVGRKAIEDHALANKIVAKETYSAADKKTLIKLSQKYGWHKLNPPPKALVQLQKVRGSLFRQPRGGALTVVANGRDDWTGWFELRRTDVTWAATYNTARVIAEQKPDILMLVEVENRPTFDRFNEQVLKAEFNFAYLYFMVIDGNDDRGIDVGVASRFPIEQMRSHVSDGADEGSEIFSRDCPEYDVILNGGARLVVIPNHFKSKRNGDSAEAIARRTRQATRAGEIARAALDRSPLVVIGGDLNDTPDSDPLQPVFADGFKDVSIHASYPKDRPGTYGTGLASGKIDYLIMSPQLQGKLKTAGVERRGSYHPGTWKPFDTVTSKVTAASDHHLIFGEFDL